MKNTIKLVFFVLTFISLNGCDFLQTSDKQVNKQQEQVMQEAVAQTGMPAITHFQERKLMKQILELRDQENLICYAYIVAEQTGNLIFLGKCIGYGLPYATQYTNPQRPARDSETYEKGNITLPQPDPNGLYMPQSAEGTWIMLINSEDNKPHPVYIESRVIVSPFPLKTK